jgi:hypothetical protein
VAVILCEGSREPDATFRLMRLVQWAGYNLADFQRIRVEEGQDVRDMASGNVLLSMGFQAGDFFGHRDLVRASRGYVYPGPGGSYVIPTVHPGFIQRGNAKWSAAFIHDLQKAVGLARNGLPATILDYRLDPSPLQAYEWAQQYVSALRLQPLVRCAFDIETPGKGDDEDDLAVGDDGGYDRTWRIDRIGFSYEPYKALSIPWAPEYMGAIRLLCESRGEKVVWNAGFDVPRIRRAGVGLHGTIHDGMVAWHILHSDLPKRLGFVATFTCPWQPAWKHLSGAKPAFYNATDADVELRSMLAIEQGLRQAGLWDVYQRDVIDLQPVLDHMQGAGMPVDAEVREDRARKLTDKQTDTRNHLESLMPLETRAIAHVYKDTPKAVQDLFSRPATRTVKVCDRCGLEKPQKAHFRHLKKTTNPCDGAGVTTVAREGVEYFRLADFSPSRDQLVRYHQFLRRPLPMIYDRVKRKQKVSFAEGEMKKLILAYPQDPVYTLVLTYRELDKLAGTYVGRYVADN